MKKNKDLLSEKSKFVRISKKAFNFSLLSIIFISGHLTSTAQNHEWTRWFHPVNNYANDSWDIMDVETDKEGNVYSVGTFRTTIIAGTDTISPHFAGSDDIYLSKMNKDGEQIWIEVIGGNWYEFPQSLHVNDTAIFLSALIQQDTYKIGDTIINSEGEYQILCFDTDANLKSISYSPDNQNILNIEASDSSLFQASWYEILEFSSFPLVKKKIEFQTSHSYQISDMEVLSDGKKLVCGIFRTSIGYQDTTLYDNFSGNGLAGFLFMLDEDDNLLWAKSYGKLVYSNLSPIKIKYNDDGMFILSLQYNTTLNFDDETIFPFHLSVHSFVAGLNMDGDLLWHKSISPIKTSASSYILDFSVNKEFIFLAGQSFNRVIFDLEDTLSSPYNTNNFILKLDFSGELYWSDISGGSSGTNRLRAITSDDNGNIYAGGLSSGVTNPKFGCDYYPDVTGGLLFHLKDEEPDDVPLTDFIFKEQGNKYFFFSEIEKDTSFYWDFDDGSGILEKVKNPGHQFPGNGEFNVQLIAENSCGQKKVSKTITIEGIKEVFPSVSGKTNLFSAEIRGAGFVENSNFRFTNTDGFDIPVTNPIFRNENSYYFSEQFLNIPLGDYHLIMENGDKTDTLRNALNIEENQDPEIQISVSGPAAILKNRFFRYRIAIRNNSNMNIPGVPVAIVGKEYQDLIILNDFADDSIMKLTYQELGTRFLPDSIGDEVIKIGFFAIPFLRAGETFYIELAMISSQDGENNIKIYSGVSFLDINYLNSDGDGGETGKKSLNAQNGSSCFGSPCADCLMSFTTFVPVLGCATGVVSLGCTIANAADDGNLSNGEMFDIGLGVVGTALSCGGAGALGKAAESSAKASKQFIGLGAEFADLGLGTAGIEGACGGGACDLNDLFEFFFDNLSSYDPNEKYGIKGKNDFNYMLPGNTINYTVTYENADTATAPASEVFIYDTLNIANYDLSSFEWTSFGFANNYYNIPAGNSNYITDVDLRPEKNIILRFEGSVDSTGLVIAKFSSLDTLSYTLTNNIFDGFLLPNQNSPEGEGFIQFSIKTKSDLNHETKIENKATIIFDVNEPIYTDTWLNTIDIVPPVSTAFPLSAATEDSLIYLQWQGIDPHSGVQNYDVYMAENDGEFERILFNIESEEAVLIGENNTKYDFYVLARDYAGNREEKIPLPEATTTVKFSTDLANVAIIADISLYPVPAVDFINLTKIPWLNENLEVKIISGDGKLLFHEVFRNIIGEFQIQLKNQNYKDGNYFILINKGDEKPIVRAFIILRN